MKNTISKITLVFLISLTVTRGFAQKYIDKTTQINFFSSTPMENIDAKNSSAISVIDASTGAMEFVVLVKAFQFEKALMQEHFNENYLESEKFPKASFKGKIGNINEVNFKKDGTYPMEIAGTLTIHGVSKEVNVKGTVKVAGGKVTANSDFSVKPEDYNISIPKVVAEKISEEIKITVSANYDA